MLLKFVPLFMTAVPFINYSRITWSWPPRTKSQFYTFL